MDEGEQLTKKEKRALAKEEKKKEIKKSELLDKLKKWGVWAVVAVVILYSGYRVVKWVSTPVSQELAEGIVVTQSDWTKGSEDAQLVLVEFADFQCPACSAYSPIISALSDEFGDELLIVYKHLPLVSIHPNAIPASKASEAAGIQEKFWEMHDMLYDRQDDWSGERNPKSKFVSYAEELDLDTVRFEEDYEGSAVEQKIQNDLTLATRLRLNSTPSFILNDQIISNPRSYEDFRMLIRNSLQE